MNLVPWHLCENGWPHVLPSRTKLTTVESIQVSGRQHRLYVGSNSSDGGGGVSPTKYISHHNNLSINADCRNNKGRSTRICSIHEGFRQRGVAVISTHQTNTPFLIIQCTVMMLLTPQRVARQMSFGGGKGMLRVLALISRTSCEPARHIATWDNVRSLHRWHYLRE